MYKRGTMLSESIYRLLACDSNQWTCGETDGQARSLQQGDLGVRV